MESKKLNDSELERVAGGSRFGDDKITVGCWYENKDCPTPGTWEYYYCKKALDSGRYIFGMAEVVADSYLGGTLGSYLGEVESSGRGLTWLGGCPYADKWINLPDELKG